MFNKAKQANDPFAFSLGGMRAIASFVAPAATADNRINRTWDEKLKRGRDESSEPAWLQGSHPAAEGTVA